MPTEKAPVLALIQEAQALLTQEAEPPHDYASLKEACARQELQDEVNGLSDLMQKDNWVDLFNARCKERAVNNRDYSLSFFAMPRGPCNELYANIALLVFEPKTLGRLLQILWPNASCVTCEVLSDHPPPSLDPQHLHIQFQEESFDTLTQAPKLDELRNFVCAGQLLLDVRDIENCSFPLHQLYFKALCDAYPTLGERLYQHSLALRALKNDLLTVSGAGRVPLQVIRAFIIELRLGGSKMTGSPIASLSAQTAFTDFKAYLDSLPTTLKLKDQLLALANVERNTTMQTVVDHLNAGKCVEQAADLLQSILANPANQELLARPPLLTEAELISLKNKYGPHNPLPTSSGSANTDFPPHLLAQVLPRIRISCGYDFLSILLSFPPEFYATLLQKIGLPTRPLSVELAEIIKVGVLNQEQQCAFDEALVLNRGRFGRAASIANFAIESNSGALLRRLVPTLSVEERISVGKEMSPHLRRIFSEADDSVLEFIKLLLDLFPDDHLAIQDTNGNTLFHLAVAKKPDLFRVILNLLPEEKRLAAVQKKNVQGKTVINENLHNKSWALCQAILELLPQKARLTIIKEIVQFIHLRFNSGQDAELELIEGFLELLPPENRLSAIQVKCMDGNMLLHRIAMKIPRLFNIIIKLLPEKDRFSAIQDRNQIDVTVIFQAFRTHDWCYYQEILELLPVEHQRLVVETKNCRIDHMFQFTDGNLERFKWILSLYPDQKDYLQMIQKYRLLNCALNWGKLETFEFILDLFPPANLLAIVQEYNYNGSVLLNTLKRPEFLNAMVQRLSEADRLAVGYALGHVPALLPHAIENPESLEIILKLLPDKDRLIAIKELGGSQILYDTVNTPDCFGFILESYPPHERLAAVQAEDYQGKTVLYSAAKNLESIQVLFGLLPLNDRLAAAQTKIEHGHTLLHPNPVMGRESHEQLVKAILSLLPGKDRLAAVSECDGNRHPVLHHWFFKIIFELLPKEDYLAAMRIRDGHGRTFLHTLLKEKEEQFEFMVQQLAEHDRLLALQEKDTKGRTLLYHARESLKLQIMILQLLPTAVRCTLEATKNMPIFYGLAPQELHTIYLKDSHNQKLRVLIMEQLHNLLRHHARHRFEASQFLVSMLKTEIAFQGDREATAAASQIPTDISSAYFLLNLYFQADTDYQRDLVKDLLCHQEAKPPKANYLALAIIAKKEDKGAESKHYIGHIIGNRFRGLFQSKRDLEAILTGLREDESTCTLVVSYELIIRGLLGLEQKSPQEDAICSTQMGPSQRAN